MGSQKRILAIDDDQDFAMATRLVLESGGYAVLSADSVSGATDVIERERPDLILLDVMLPHGTEGFDLVADLRLRLDSYFRNVPIVILSAIHYRTNLRFYPDTTQPAPEGLPLPIQDFIDKPVHPSELLTRVARALTFRAAPKDEEGASVDDT
jgi:two-component system, OmpR family, phosphate regulon response regulator PhoB